VSAARRHLPVQPKKSRAAGLLILLCAVAGLVALPAQADDVPSCYQANKMPAPRTDRAIFVLIDQTTLLDAELRRSVMANTGNFIKPGTAFTVAAFSAFAQGRYLNITKTGTLEAALPEAARNGVKFKTLETFDACMAGQWHFGLKIAAGALTAALGGASATLAKSDVEASIRALANVVRASPAKDRVVLIVSDMLENSNVSSFYGHQNVRLLNPAREMALARAASMLGDFGGARVYVIGAGVMPEGDTKKGGVYRDPKTMGALSKFWALYFQASNADLAGFGQPALLTPVR
jgi:hypothetical protein